ncbi:MAG: RHS repeat-associated core domain-containing protein, partial [Alphaproteobacteria bacterium]
STPTGGGSAVTTSYLWCGMRICQARNASNAVTREHYAEGELVPGSPAQPYYYGPDQLGSVRRAFASTSSAPAYSYDPYGNPLQATAPVTDFVYAGMFYNADSGLYLTRYRAYNPAIGRWLSRDPIGEASDPAANLYRYVNGNPVSFTDPLGLLTLQVGGTVSFSLGALSFSATGGLIVDTCGNAGFYGTAGGGVGGGSFVKFGASGAVSGAPTIYDLQSSLSNTGLTRVTSFTIGLGGVGGSLDIGQGYGQNGTLYSSYGGTLGSVTGGGVTMQYQYTQVRPVVQWTSPAVQPAQ